VSVLLRLKASGILAEYPNLSRHPGFSFSLWVLTLVSDWRVAFARLRARS